MVVVVDVVVVVDPGNVVVDSGTVVVVDSGTVVVVDPGVIVDPDVEYIGVVVVDPPGRGLSPQSTA